jgi:nitrite reductase/ring-hydroxylating ferredoxin subunit
MLSSESLLPCHAEDRLCHSELVRNLVASSGIGLFLAPRFLLRRNDTIAASRHTRNQTERMTSDNLLTAFGVDRRMGRGEIRTIRRGRDVTVAARLESSLWPALWNYWHPVAFSADVTDKPHAAKLLDQRLVLARLGDRLACFRDLCVHRGTPLSLGWIDGEELVCAYHGWCYDAAGACTRIPALPADHPIPRRARAEAFATEERYGIVWVCSVSASRRRRYRRSRKPTIRRTS